MLLILVDSPSGGERYECAHALCGRLREGLLAGTFQRTRVVTPTSAPHHMTREQGGVRPCRLRVHACYCAVRFRTNCMCVACGRINDRADLYVVFLVICTHTTCV